MKIKSALFLSILAPFLAFGAGDELKNAYIFGVTEKTNALAYAVGEEMVFTLSVKGAKALPKTPLWLQWSREGDDGVRASGKEPLSLEKPLVIRTRLGKPGFVHVGADVVDAQGNRWDRYDSARGVEGARGLHYDGGAGTNPRELHESPGEPKDFDAFWAERKARLAKLPLVVDRREVGMAKPVAGVRAYAVSVNCAGPRPVTGYLYLPERPGRYRAEVRFDGYSGDSVQKPNDGGLSPDLIVFHINAHGYELGREPEYYREFYESIMIGGTYAFDARQNKAAGSAYFSGMTWRVLRALQYVKSLPEWDGANLHVRGGSQGGLQAIWAAGLDPDVSSVTTHVTWCCDMAGPKTQGRMQGWWPEWTEALGYFDAVYHAKRIASKAEVSIVKAALGDTCSRPSSLAVLYNNIPCKKQIVWVQGASHGYVMPGAPTWKTEDVPMDFDGELFNPKTEAFKHPDVTWKPQWSVVANATSVTMAYPEKGTNRVSQWAHAGFDFAGAAFTGFEFEIDVECLGCDADDPAAKATFLAMPCDAAGKTIYAGANYDFRKGGRQTLRVSWSKPSLEIRSGTLGLNAVFAGPGKVVFHTDTLRYRPLPFPFPRVNEGHVCRYTDTVTKRPVCRGTMVRARTVTPKDIDDLADAGATLIRFPLCADCLPKASKPTNRAEEIAYFRNWLKAGLDHFEADILPVCRRRGIRVALGVFDAPGRKPDGHDFALFRDEGYLREWIRQWEAIALRFKGNEDVIYGYDLLNEPHQVGLAKFDYWTIQKLCAKAIRRIDRVTPIIFESNQADDVDAYAYMSPVDIENVIYEAHMYHPFPFTHQGVGTLPSGFRYPDAEKGWDHAFLEKELQPLFDFAKRHGARVYVGEFSAATWGEGGDEWVRDVISILNRHSVDWSYHCFREWKGWDPERSPVRWRALTSGWREGPAAAKDEDVQVRSLDGTWRFLRDDDERTTATAADYDDRAWQSVTVPHDWAIEGPFDPKQGGWQGKLPWRGAGWYRRAFDLAADEAKAFAARERVAYLEFDGVMARPEVYVNGTKAGGWDYGYMSFALDVSSLLKPGRNVLAVKASTKSHGSRWYPGAGLYRSVRFVSRPKDHVLPGTLAITTQVRGLKVSDGVPQAESAAVNVSYESSVEGPKTMSFEVANPRLWDLGKGGLYALDLLGERFSYGIRDFRFDVSEGFVLNGRRVPLNGVNLHSDLGPLGAAFDRDAVRRQFLIMKDMGVNALRTSHNATDPYVLELCDEFGFFAWNECFDKWGRYAGRRDDENLEEYVSRNLRQFVRRDRNHPSVFCWSIGNEINPINHDGKPNGMTNARFTCFRNAIRELDTTRPVAIGCCSGLGDLVDFNLLDLVGWNYGAGYRRVRKQYPKLPVLCSESASAVSEYGFYEQPPAESKTDYARATLQVGSYDHNAAPWSDIPDVEFARMAADRYCCGEFVWTGIDYLGEPTPIAPSKDFGITNANEQCARSSYFGAVDLCGIPKDRFYLYRSHWNRSAETVHILPHWNWSVAGGKVPVYVYTSGDSVELFLNGRSLGLHCKGEKPGHEAGLTNAYYDVCSEYRLRWFDVTYEPGELKAVAYRDGRKVGEAAVHTAGTPVAVKLTDDPYNPPGAMTRFVQVDAVDARGVRDPLSSLDVRFALSGPGEIVAVGNGNPKDHKSFKDVEHHPLHYGKCVVVVRRTGAGDLRLKASADGLAPTTLTIQ